MPNVVTVNVTTLEMFVLIHLQACDLPLPARPVIPMIVFLDMRASFINRWFVLGADRHERHCFVQTFHGRTMTPCFNRSLHN